MKINGQTLNTELEVVLSDAQQELNRIEGLRKLAAAEPVCGKPGYGYKAIRKAKAHLREAAGMTERAFAPLLVWTDRKSNGAALPTATRLARLAALGTVLPTAPLGNCPCEGCMFVQTCE